MPICAYDLFIGGSEIDLPAINSEKDLQPNPKLADSIDRNFLRVEAGNCNCSQTGLFFTHSFQRKVILTPAALHHALAMSDRSRQHLFRSVTSKFAVSVLKIAEVAEIKHGHSPFLITESVMWKANYGDLAFPPLHMSVSPRVSTLELEM
ncbi:hypothetical protein Tcan_00700, partial [Toxocara canis]